MNNNLCKCKKEKFKKLLGWEDIYMIGNHGTIIALERRSRPYANGKTHFIPEHIKKSSFRTNYYMIWLHGKEESKQDNIHRLVAKNFVSNPYNNKSVDHIDCNKKNNCFKNLRWVSHSENMHNTNKHSNLHKSRGIYYHLKNKNWVADIRVNKQKIHIGCFSKKEEAQEAYNIYAKKYYGENARTSNTIKFN